MSGQTIDVYRRGFVFICTRSHYLREARTAIKALRRFHPEPVIILTDVAGAQVPEKNCQVIHIDSSAIRPKVHFLRNDMFEATIYLDTDVFVDKPLDEVFDLLERFDVVATHDLARKRMNVASVFPEYATIPYSFPELNTGVIGFRRGVANDLLSAWEEIYLSQPEEIGPWDQPSFRVACWQSTAKLGVLPPEFNVRRKKVLKKVIRNRRQFGRDHLKPRIFHQHLSLLIHRGVYIRIPLRLLQAVLSWRSNRITH